MFEENPEVVEKPKKVKKQMSPERKEALREQLRKAREKKKANKVARTKKVKEPEPVKMEIIEEPSLSAKKEEIKINKPLSPIKEEIEPVVDNSKEIIANLKAEIAELKKGKTTSDDMAEIRALKLEMKDIRDAAKLYKEQKKKLAQQSKVVKPKVVKEPVKEVVKEQAKQAIVKPVKRYSTYKKSIWADLL